MAGHLPINITPLIKQLTSESILALKGKKEFEKVDLPFAVKVKSMLLPTKDYNMDEETGLVDSKIISVTLYSETDEIYEIHLDKKDNINVVYLVM